MSELIFNVTREADGGYVAIAVGESIVTQGDTWEELRKMVRDAVQHYFYDSLAPGTIRLDFAEGAYVETVPFRRRGMTKLAGFSVITFAVAAIGVVLELVFQPLGICGSGGWVTYPVLLGAVAVPVFCMSGLIWLIRLVVRRIP